MTSKFIRAAILAALPGALACGTGTDEPQEQQQVLESSASALTIRRPARVVAPPASPLGVNLAPFSGVIMNWPFVDAIKSSIFFSGEVAGAFSDGRPLDLDANGWVRSLLPGQAARRIILANDTSNSVPIPTGVFTIMYEGDGDIEYSIGTTVLSTEPGKHRVQSSILGFSIAITRTNPANYLRNIRVILPGGRCGNDEFQYCESSNQCTSRARCVPFTENYTQNVFHPTFLAELKKFKTLRFMDWMQTNRESIVPDVSEIPLVRKVGDYPNMLRADWRSGVPVNIMIDLANKIGADAYFTIPHTANDTTVAALAIYTALRLGRSQRVFVEYSNEAWNEVFDQHQWINRKGCMQFSPNPAAECDVDGPGTAELCAPSEYNAAQERCKNYGVRYYGKRSAEIMRIFELAFGTTRSTRLVRVLGSQRGRVDDLARRALEVPFLNGKVSDHIDAVAIGVYFTVPYGATPQDTFATNTTEIDGWPVGTYSILTVPGGPLDGVRRDQAFLDGSSAYAHIELMAYGGSEHFFADSEAAIAAILPINRDSRMTLLYEQLLNHWTALTSKALFLHHMSSTLTSRFGKWGFKEYQGQPRCDAPMYHALLSHMERGQMVPVMTCP